MFYILISHDALLKPGAQLLEWYVIKCLPKQTLMREINYRHKCKQECGKKKNGYYSFARGLIKLYTWRKNTVCYTLIKLIYIQWEQYVFILIAV